MGLVDRDTRAEPGPRRAGAQAAVGLIGGELDNLPVRAGLATAFPYLGFAPHLSGQGPSCSRKSGSCDRVLHRARPDRTAMLKRWFRRCRVTHLVDYRGINATAVGKELGRWRDRRARSNHLSRRRASRRAGSGRSSSWTQPFPEARVASRARTIDDRRALIDRLSRSDDQDIAWFLAEDGSPDRPDARSARLLDWDGSMATVEHDGPCDLIMAQASTPAGRPGSMSGPEWPVLPVDGGFQAVRLDGSGTHRVTLHYRTPRLALWSAITIVAAILDLIVCRLVQAHDA